MTVNNHQIHTGEIFTKALNLTGKQYQERPVVGKYRKATALIQCVEKKCFWFVDNQNLNQQLNLLKSIN